MNLKHVQEKLNEMFEGDSRKLVFWYDDKAEFCESIKDLKLENAQIYRLKQDNWLYTKYFLEVEDTTTNYLIYAQFSRPNDEDNYLADIVYYATPFCADKISIIAQELKVPEEFKEVLRKYPKFWNANSRFNSFKDLNIEHYSEETINVAILCVLAKVKIVNFDEVLKKVITEENLTENKYLAKFEKCGILDVFWDLCREKYGYSNTNPNIEKFLINLLITYTSTQFEGNIPKAWEKLLSKRKNDITVFVNNLMSNINYKDKYDVITEKIAKKINLGNLLKKIPVESYFHCDTFEIFDKNIISHLTDLLISNKEKVQCEDLLHERQKTHFYNKYAGHYSVIRWANYLISYINKFSKETYPTDVKGMINAYCGKWFVIDRSYREFYFAYDNIEEKDELQDLRQLIENMYTNTYLSELAMLWSDKLEKCESHKDLPVNKQYNFYKDNVRPAIIKQKTAVIISDAFRYECADELKYNLDLDPTRSTEIKPMVSTIPSYTSLGMACLLPHQKVQYDENYKVLVDDKPCSSTGDRQKILETHHSNSMALNYDHIMSLNMANLRKELKNKDLIYVYHNQVDARGDNPSSENEVFNASKEAISEIVRLITKLTNEAGIKNYFITADHGFIYKRDKLNESDKVNLSQKTGLHKNKRYLLSKEELNIEGTLNYSLDYLDKDDIRVTVPRGVDIFKIKGAGQNYVHGGSSLQEIIIPMLHVKSKAASKNQDYVELNLISLNKRITNLNTFLTFAQKENVSNRVLPLEANLFFEDENGEQISNEVIIYANKKVDSARDREFKEKFTLRNRRYSKSKKYYLVIKNMENDVEINRYEFTIDIAISDDFIF